jgi:hypothetical protein
MSAPQMKEGPASSMLRAMFAGFGSLMSVMDRVRNKPAAKAPADTEAPAAATTPAPEEAAAAKDTATPETVVAETTAADSAAPEAAAPASVAGPETVVAEAPVEPEASPAAETVAPEAVAPETAEPAASTHPETAAAEVPAAASPSGALPLANYDELTVASLRARLRNLSNGDLNQLMTYEQAHQNRPEVIKMFQNRLIKMTTGMPKLEE